MAITAKSILHRAVDLLQDQTSVRWPMAELVRYFNDAQRIIVKARPDALNTTVTKSLTAGVLQTLDGLTPTPAKLLEVTSNMAGDLSAVTKVERAMLDAGNRNWYTAAAATSIKHFMFDPRDPLAFYVYPPAASGAQLEVMYSAYPTDIAEPANGTTWNDVVGDATIPEIYADDVLNIVLAKAYQKDSEFAGNAERAAFYLALVDKSLGAEIAATVANQPRPAMK